MKLREIIGNRRYLTENEYAELEDVDEFGGDTVIWRGTVGPVVVSYMEDDYQARYYLIGDHRLQRRGFNIAAMPPMHVLVELAPHLGIDVKAIEQRVREYKWDHTLDEYDYKRTLAYEVEYELSQHLTKLSADD